MTNFGNKARPFSVAGRVFKQTFNNLNSGAIPFRKDKLVSSEIDKFFEESNKHPSNRRQSQKVPLSLKKKIRDTFKDLTDVKSLPQNITRLIENLAKETSQNSRQTNTSSRFTKSQRGYRGVVQPQFIGDQDGSNNAGESNGVSGGAVVPGDVDGSGGPGIPPIIPSVIPPIGEGEDTGNASIMIELSQIWYNIRSKLQTYVHMFWQKVSCPLLKKALGIIYNYGIQDLDNGLQEIFKMLFGSKQADYVFLVCNY